MRRMNVLTAALVAGLTLPTTASAADGESPSSLRSRDGSPRTERVARPAPARTGAESQVRGHDDEADGRSAGEPGASARRDGNGVASFDSQLGGQGRAVEPMTSFRRGFDADENGAFSADERRALDRALVAYHRSLRSAIDRDRDGLIGDHDWKTFLESTYGEHAERYVARDAREAETQRGRHDADRDGSLSKEEQQAFAVAMDGRRLLQLERLDRDADAVIGERELAFAGAQVAAVTFDNHGGTRFRATVKRRAFGTQTATGTGVSPATRSAQARDDRP